MEFEATEISPDFLSSLDNEGLIKIHTQSHSKIREDPDNLNEDLINAHVFIWLELVRRGLSHSEEDKLDEESKFWVQEYPTIRIPKKKSGGIITLEEFISSLPGEIKIDSHPPFIELIGGIVNRGFSENDIDLKIHSEFDPVLAESILAQIDPKFRDKIHLVWDSGKEQIGRKIPLFYPEFKRFKIEENHEVRKEEIELFTPITPMKVSGGWGRAEFDDPGLLWEKWAASHGGPWIIQPKYDGLYFQIHLSGDGKVGFYTQDEKRDRSQIFIESVGELIRAFKGISLIITAEMVEYKGEYKGGEKEPEEIMESIPREDMIKWIGAIEPGSEEGIVFHIHDCLFLNGESLLETAYLDRIDKFSSLLKGRRLIHFREVKKRIVGELEKVPFLEMIEWASNWPGSEGAMVKQAEAKYGSQSWAKVKNYKSIDSIVLSREEVKDSPGVWNYQMGVSLEGAGEEKLDQNFIEELGGKKYMRIGQTFNSSLDVEPGRIIEVKIIRVRRYESEDGARWTWMFPRIERLRDDKSEPNSLEYVKSLEKIGTKRKDDVFTSLEECTHYKDDRVCPLYKKFTHPWGGLSKEVWREKLQFPISCEFASRMKCRYVKNYYYDFEPVRKQFEEIYLAIPEPEENGKMKFVIQDHLRGRGIEELNGDEEKAILEASDEEIVETGGHARKLIEEGGGKIIPSNRREEEERGRVNSELLRGGKSPLIRAMIKTSGLSIHNDFRYSVGSSLRGWTITGLIWGTPWEFIPTPGMDGKKMRVEVKAAQPNMWLKGLDDVIVDEEMEGLREIIEDGELGFLSLPFTIEKMEGRVPPGSPGATREKGGLLRVRDRGTIYIGAQKSLFHEYWLFGEKIFKEGVRVVVRGMKLPVLDEGGEPIKGEYELVHTIWVPEDQSPYALSSRASKKGYIPKKGHIPIPEKFRSGEAWEKWSSEIESKWKEYPEGNLV